MARERESQVLRSVPVSAVMTSRVYSVTPTWTLLSVARLLRNHHISGVPVVDENDRVVGIVSESDLFADLHRAAGIGSARGLLDLLLTAGGYRSRNLLEQCLHHLRRTRVSSAMQAKPVVVDRDSSLGEAARLLRRHKVNRLPVVEDGRLVGILTRQDVVEAVTGPGAVQRPRSPPRYRRGPPTP